MGRGEDSRVEEPQGERGTTGLSRRQRRRQKEKPVVGRGGEVHTEGSPLQCDHNGQSSETTQLSITGRRGKETRAPRHSRMLSTSLFND